MGFVLRAAVCYLLVGWLYGIVTITTVLVSGNVPPCMLSFSSRVFSSFWFLLTWPKYVYYKLCHPGRRVFAYGLMWACLFLFLIGGMAVPWGSGQ